MLSTIRRLSGLSVLLSFACAHAPAEPNADNPAEPNAGDVITRDGFRLWKDTFNSDLGTLGGQASFDLNCSKDQLTFRVIDLMTGPGFDDWASNIGVTGCGQQARYTRTRPRALGESGTWVLQSQARQPNAPAPGPAPTPATSI